MRQFPLSPSPTTEYATTPVPAGIKIYIFALHQTSYEVDTMTTPLSMPNSPFTTMLTETHPFSRLPPSMKASPPTLDIYHQPMPPMMRPPIVEYLVTPSVNFRAPLHSFPPPDYPSTPPTPHPSWISGVCDQSGKFCRMATGSRTHSISLLPRPPLILTASKLCEHGAYHQLPERKIETSGRLCVL